MIERSEIAKSLYRIVNLYSDYLEIGFLQKNESIDFSFWNRENFFDKKIVEKDSVKEKSDRENLKNISPLPNRANKKGDGSKIKEIIELAERISKCKMCPLSTESKVVTGAGDPNSDIVVVSDYVSSNYEEESALPLNGRELNAFKKWVEAISIDSSSLFFTHMIKCHPKRLKITADSISSCMKHLEVQIDIIKPKFILCLGERVATQLGGKQFSFIGNREDFFYYKGIKVFTIFHPRDVEAREELKKPLWAMLKKFKNYIQANEQ